MDLGKFHSLLLRLTIRLRSILNRLKPLCTGFPAPGINYCIDSKPSHRVISAVSDLSGWCFAPDIEQLPRLRVRSISLRGIRTITDYVAAYRPDVREVFKDTPISDQSGFHFSIPLSPLANYLRLEVELHGKWFILWKSCIYRSMRQQAKQSPIPKRITVKQKQWPSDRPLVSVVIPCFNYGQYIEQAIDSVLNQTFQNLEVIVVDGGSNDGKTIEKLKTIKKPRTKIYFRQGRHLVGDNRNFGIDKARGKYICCLDADDMLKTTYIEKAVFIAEAFNWDVVYPSVQCFGDSDVVWRTSDVDFMTCVQGNGISTVALFTKTAWSKVGGYRDWGVGKDLVHEDWEFWVRLLGNGFRAKSIREPLMLYRVHGSGLCSGNTKTYEEHSRIIQNENRKLLNERNLKRIGSLSSRSYTVRSPFINLRSQAPGGSKGSILFALPFMIIGGADTVLLQISRFLHEDGYSLSYLTTIPTELRDGDNTPRYEEISRNIYHLPQFLSNESEWKDFVFYLIEARRIDMIFLVGSTFIYELLPEIKERYPNIKVVDQLFNEHGHIADNRKYAGLIDMNIVATDVVAAMLKLNYGERDCKIKKILHGVDAQHEFNPDIEISDPTLNPFNFNPDKFTVSYFGRFSEEKKPESFIEIANALKDVDIQFVMVGNGPLYDSVKAQCADYGLGDKVCIPGFIDDIKPILKNSDVVVIPSRIEGVPIILLESLSMGIPVVGSRVGGIPGVIQDAYNGFLCPSEDIGCFVDKIRLLFDHPELMAGMSKNAKEYAREHLDISRMRDEYLDTCAKVLRN